MSPHEVLQLAVEAIVEALKQRGHDIALHANELNVIENKAKTIISYKASDGTKIISYEVHVRLFEVA